MSVQRRNKTNLGWQDSFRESGPYMGLGIQLAFSMVFFTAIGYFIDHWLDTLPWFLLGGAALGMVAIFTQVIRVSKAMSERSRRDRDERRKSGQTKDPDRV